jgi:hypothetical protein
MDDIAAADALTGQMASGMKWTEAQVEDAINHGVLTLLARRGIIRYEWNHR